MEIALAALGALMLLGLIWLSGSLGSEDVRARRRWDARFERESRELRRTDATGVVVCRSCGASASERAGVCARCGARL